MTSTVEVDSESNTVVALKRSDSVKRSNFVRLREGVWLDDELINFVSKQVLEPVMDRGHAYSSFFFSRLLREGEMNPQYDFSGVQRWHTRIEAGIFNLRELFVPINKDNSHWLLLRVDFEASEITLWDSLGSNSCNQAYL